MNFGTRRCCPIGLYRRQGFCCRFGDLFRQKKARVPQRGGDYRVPKHMVRCKPFIPSACYSHVVTRASTIITPNCRLCPTNLWRKATRVCGGAPLGPAAARPDSRKAAGPGGLDKKVRNPRPAPLKTGNFVAGSLGEAKPAKAAKIPSRLCRGPAIVHRFLPGPRLRKQAAVPFQTAA